jgi:hypothetical protein
MSEWYEVILEGPAQTVRGFLAGFVAGRGSDDGAIFGDDIDLAAESLGERIKALFAKGSHHALFAREPFATEFEQALERYGPAIEIQVFRHRAVDTGSFGVSVETFSRETAEGIRTLFRQSMANGVRIEQFVENEETHPEAHGTELYAPMHEYAYSASGHVSGPVRPAIELWRRARQYDCVKVEPLHVNGDAK